MNLCPFARQPFTRGQIEYIVCKADNTEARLHKLIEAFVQLDSNPDIETSLLIFTDPALNFDHYLDLLALANALLDEYQYTGIYQLASFHPDYLFDGSDIDDAANYSNRSPYPMLHCIRETSLEKALAGYPDPESIPDNNIKRLRATGKKALQDQLEKL